MKEYLGSRGEGQLWLFIPQLALLALAFLRYLSLFYVTPIIVVLSALWGWLDYTQKTQKVALEILSQFDLILDDFGHLNFEPGEESVDRRIVKLLDIVPFSSDSVKPEIASAKVPTIKDLSFVFQFWYFSMRDRVRMMMRKAGVLLDYDLVELANDFVELYNGYLNKVAEGTIKLLNKQELVNSQKAREVFRGFSSSLSELRGKTNTFLKSLRGYGYSISGTDARAFEIDPWSESLAENSRSDEESLQ